MIDLFHGPILKAVKSMLPKVTDTLHKIVEKLNVLLKNHDENSFNVDVLNCGSPLNLTMTKAPVLDDKSGLIIVNFDGTFFDTIAKSNHVSMP
jgi:hypothetical protein